MYWSCACLIYRHMPANPAPHREVTEGLSTECPTVWDEELNGTRPEATCRKRLGIVKEVHCDMKNQVGLLVLRCCL